MSRPNLLNGAEWSPGLLAQRRRTIVVGGVGRSTYDIPPPAIMTAISICGAQGRAVMIGPGHGDGEAESGRGRDYRDGEMLMGIGSLATSACKQAPGNRPSWCSTTGLWRDRRGRRATKAATVDLVGVARSAAFADDRRFGPMADVEHFARPQEVSSGPRFASSRSTAPIWSAALQRDAD